MLKKLTIFFVSFIILFALDRYIKNIFVDGFEWHSSCISLVLAYNKGVAFSFFAFLGEYLKYIQISLFVAILLYIAKHKDIFFRYYIPFIFLFVGGISNIYDRFIFQGVVDYVYWHCYFDFAIFNLADVFIDIAIVLFLYLQYKDSKLQQPDF